MRFEVERILISGSVPYSLPSLSDDMIFLKIVDSPKIRTLKAQAIFKTKVMFNDRNDTLYLYRAHLGFTVLRH